MMFWAPYIVPPSSNTFLYIVENCMAVNGRHILPEEDISSEFPKCRKRVTHALIQTETTVKIWPPMVKDPYAQM